MISEQDQFDHGEYFDLVRDALYSDNLTKNDIVAIIGNLDDLSRQLTMIKLFPYALERFDQTRDGLNDRLSPSSRRRVVYNLLEELARDSSTVQAYREYVNIQYYGELPLSQIMMEYVNKFKLLLTRNTNELHHVIVDRLGSIDSKSRLTTKEKRKMIISVG